MAYRRTHGKRNVRQISFRKPYLGHYIIITDAKQTEPNYFNGLKASLPKKYRNNIVIKVISVKTTELIEKAVEEAAYNPNYSQVWIVFDRDYVDDFDGLIRKAEQKGIKVAWSNPCFEQWMYNYFGKAPNIDIPKKMCDSFAKEYHKKTGKEYTKSCEDIYQNLNKYGDENKAVKSSKDEYEKNIRDGKTNPKDMVSCNKVYELVSEIKDKVVEE